jgi:hypothetical protein
MAAASSPSPSQAAARKRLVAQVSDMTDVLRLAAPAHRGFTVASRDDKHDITMATMAVEGYPIHMMKATAAMPCSPAEFMTFLDIDVRPKWDEHFRAGRLLERVNDAVYFKHLLFAAPVPLLNSRDFEVCVSEVMMPDGTAVLKAVSSSADALFLPTPARRVTRGEIKLSGFVIRPVPAAPGSAKVTCVVTYIALIHPMGAIPAVLVNMLVGKQTKALRNLQSYIATHELSPQQREAARLTSAARRHHPGGANLTSKL